MKRMLKTWLVAALAAVLTTVTATAASAVAGDNERTAARPTIPT